MNRGIFSLLFAVLIGGAGDLSAQGTAFNYQGRLSDGGTPANGRFDLRFAIYDAVTNGTQMSVSLTNAAVPVSNGLFNVTLDFGPNIFTGSNCWLDIAVKATNVAAFTVLAPRQPVLPVPYAMFAAKASNVVGSVSAAQITGTAANPVNFTNNNNQFGGAFSGIFSGNGAALTNLNASNLATGTVADGRLSTNVALLNGNQTFSGTNSFTNWNNSFTGSFFGNGLVGWIATNGQAIQAERNHGYMLTSSGLAKVTLPQNASLAVGDIVRVSGAGGGGWAVTNNSGQSVFGTLATYKLAHLRNLQNAPSSSYNIAASEDGARMYLVGSFGGVYLSTDYGNTFNQVGTLAPSQSSVDCSADGMTVYIANASSGIQKSTDGGVTWTSLSVTGTNVACTADGSQYFNGLYACSGNGTYLAKWTTSSIKYATNGSLTTPFTINAPAGSVGCVAVSSDCSRVVAGMSGGYLYASADFGTHWTQLTKTNQYWRGVWMSADGSRFAAAAANSGGAPYGVYACEIKPMPNIVSTNSTINGSQGTAVEIQYLGNGQFMPVSSSGLIWAN